MTNLPPEITEDPRYRRVRDERERHAAVARASQAQYRWLTRVFVIASAIAAIAGGLVLYGTEAAPDARNPLVRALADGSAVRIGLIVVQGFGLAAAAGSGYLLGRREPGKRWVTARLKAEDGRLAIAERALQIAHEKGPEAFHEAGAWFIAFLEGQLSHLDASARRRDRSALRGLIFAAVLTGLAALAGVLSGFESKTIVVVLAILGVGVPALTAAVEKWGEATADSKRAALHGETWTALNALRDDVPGFEAAVLAQDFDSAMIFANRVFAVLREDHTGFASAMGEGDAAIRRKSEAEVARVSGDA